MTPAPGRADVGDRDRRVLLIRASASPTVFQPYSCPAELKAMSSISLVPIEPTTVPAPVAGLMVSSWRGVPARSTSAVTPYSVPLVGSTARPVTAEPIEPIAVAAPLADRSCTGLDTGGGLVSAPSAPVAP